MARLSMNEVTTYRWSFEEDVANYVEAGLPAIGVWRQKLSDFGEEKGVELLSDSGLKVSNLLWAGGFTGSDGRSFSESVADAMEAIRLAAAMKAPCLVLYSGARAGHTHNHARRLFRDALKRLVPVASEFGVDLAVEPMHPSIACDWTFLTSLEDTLELIDQIDSPAVKIVCDTYHLGHEPAIVEEIPRLVDRIAIVHLGDASEPLDGEQNRCRLGKGSLPLKEIVAALAGAGYDGYYDVELIGEEMEAADYRDVIEHSQSTFAQMIACQTA